MRPQGPVKLALFPDHDLALPVLSKDGKWLSAVDLKTHTTKIFNIDNGGCEEKIDLQACSPPARSISVADKKLITFHKMNNEKTFNPEHPYTRSAPSATITWANVYVYNLETGDL